jgi:glycosyltransferase involved in cell wall biosynthesis
MLPAGNVRVLHAIAPGPVGGAETAVLSLVQGLKDADVPVVIVALADSSSAPFVERVRDAGVPIEVVRASGRTYWRDWAGIRAAVRHHGLTLIHTHGYRADMMGLLAARTTGVRCLATAHGFTGGDRKNRLNQRLAITALKRHDAVVSVSAPLATVLAKAGIRPERIQTIPNAWRVPSERALDRSVARESLALPATGPVIGWVGRLSPVKGADVAVAAMSAVTTPGLQLVFIGDGPERAALGRQVVQLGLQSRVRFAGARPDAASLLGAFDALVLSSRSEGTPMVLLEASHAGTPIVATAVGGVPDLLGAAGGLLVPPEDPAALAAAIDTVFARPADAHARVASARARIADNYDASVWVGRHVALYHRLLENRS